MELLFRCQQDRTQGDGVTLYVSTYAMQSQNLRLRKESASNADILFCFFSKLTGSNNRSNNVKASPSLTAMAR